MRGETGRGDDRKRPRGNDMRNDPRNERKDLFMKKTLWTLTSAAALLCVAAMATAEAPVATGETAWLRGKPVATYTCAGKTVIVIAHRLRTIANADKIVVLDDGNIVEEGTHDDLVSSNGLYRHLWDLQLRSSSWGANGRMAAEGAQ